MEMSHKPIDLEKFASLPAGHKCRMVGTVQAVNAADNTMDFKTIEGMTMKVTVENAAVAFAEQKIAADTAVECIMTSNGDGFETGVGSGLKNLGKAGDVDLALWDKATKLMSEERPVYANWF